MADDIAPELWEKIQKEFYDALNEDNKLKRLYEKISDGSATYEEANAIARLIGKHSSEAIQIVLKDEALPDGVLYYNIAERTIKPALEQDYEIVADAAFNIQKQLNEKAQIGLNPVKAEKLQDRIEGIVSKAADAGSATAAAPMLRQNIENYTQAVVDNSVQKNAELHYNAGMKPLIKRVAVGGCCDWCRKRAGNYQYPEVPKDIYQRHRDCNCLVTYTPGNGKYQNVHIKKQWFDSETEVDQEALKRQQEKLNTRYNKKGEELEKFLYAEPTRKEFLERAEKYKNTEKNYGIIARKLASGNYPMEYRHEKYLQHSNGDKKYLEASEKRKKLQSYLTISEEDATTTAWKYAGTGAMKITNDGDNVELREYYTADKIVGKVYDAKEGGFVDTDRVLAIYSNKGLHIVPTTKHD